MDAEKVLEMLKKPCNTEDWRVLMDLLSEGYRGMYMILRILYESKEDISAGGLAKEMNVSTARVASALNGLEGKGFITRKVDTRDARKVIIRLTDEGEQAFVKRKNEVVQRLQPILNKLTDDESMQLLDLLNKLIG